MTLKDDLLIQYFRGLRSDKVLHDPDVVRLAILAIASSPSQLGNAELRPAEQGIDDLIFAYIRCVRSSIIEPP